jgi:hypothetical protein
MDRIVKIHRRQANKAWSWLTGGFVMAYHIPFAHRRRGCPVYIGFDEPMVIVRPKRRFNGWGLASFLTLIFSVGILAPLALLMGLFGMRRSPRTLATFSTVVAGGITALMALGITAGIRHEHAREARREHARWMERQAGNVRATQGMIAKAEDDLIDYQQSHEGQLPAEYDGMLLTVTHSDAWKNPLRYEIGNGNYYIRSAGPDEKYETSDDIKHRIGSNESHAEFQAESQPMMIQF